jgi:hypothetical protein
MKSTLLIVACIALIILVLKKYNIQGNKHRQATTAASQSVINRGTYSLLKEEVKMWAGYNY